MILAHGDRVVQYLSTDYSGLISDLKNPNTVTKFIRYHPAHLPATTYALAFMKLHAYVVAGRWTGWYLINLVTIFGFFRSLIKPE